MAKTKKPSKKRPRTPIEQYRDVAEKVADQIASDLLSHLSEWLNAQVKVHAAKLAKSHAALLKRINGDCTGPYWDGPFDVEGDLLLRLNGISDSVEDVGGEGQNGLYCHVQLDVAVPEPPDPWDR